MKWAMIIFFFLTLSSCTDKDEESADVMSRDKFVAVLIDVHVADARVSHLLGQDMETRLEHYHYYKDVFEKHEVTREEFREAFYHYGSDNERLHVIYEEVMDSIKRRKARLQPLLHRGTDSVEKE